METDTEIGGWKMWIWIPIHYIVDGAKYHLNCIKVIEPNSPLAYAPGMEIHHPIMSMLGGERRTVI